MPIVNWRVGLREKLLALTFDDGPSAWTAPVLDVLRGHGARATFFVIGEHADDEAEILRRLLREGSEIGNHTYSHPRLLDSTEDTIRVELQKANAAIEAAGVEPVRWFRPPYLERDARVDRIAAEVGFDAIVLSSVFPGDWRKDVSAEEIVADVIANAAPGAIVLLHDGWPRNENEVGSSREQTLDALIELVPTLQSKGYELVTLTELLAARAAF